MFPIPTVIRSPPKKISTEATASVKEKGKRKKNQGKLFPDATKPDDVVPAAGNEPVTDCGAQVPRFIEEGRPPHDFPVLVIIATRPLPHVARHVRDALRRVAVWKHA